MNVTLKLCDVGHFLESQKLVGKHDPGSLPNIHHLSFAEVKACCSLSNQSFMNRTLHRIYAFLKTWQWMNDSKIGTSLYFECLWMNSSVAHDIEKQNNSRKQELLEQIDLINNIFEQIIFKKYKRAGNSHLPNAQPSMPEKNNANPGIANMFPICQNGNYGVELAHALSNKIKNIGNLFQQDNSYQSLVKQPELTPISIRCAMVTQSVMIDSIDTPTYHQLNKKIIDKCLSQGVIEGKCCWSQSVIHDLLPTPIIKEFGCTVSYDAQRKRLKHDSDPQRDLWWKNQSEQDKVKAICQKDVTLKENQRVVSHPKSTSFLPFKIRFDLS